MDSINLIEQFIVKAQPQSMAYPQRSSWGSFTNPQYNRLQSQIEQETLNLLRQRENISNQFGENYFYEPYLNPVESQKYIKLNIDKSNRNISNSRNIISDKVKQLLDLCRGQNSAFSNQLVKVLEQEKNIYNDLASNGQSSQKTQYFGVTNPIIQAQKQSSVVYKSQQRLASNRSSGNQSPTKMNLTAKPDLKDALQKNGKTLTGEELIQMIEQIEQKALNEIEKLRQQKIELMKQLKNQIQSNNELQKEVNQYVQQSRSQNQRQNNNSTPYKQFQFDGQTQSQKKSLQDEILRQIRVQMDNLRRENESLRSLNSNQPMNGFNSENSQEIYSLKQTVIILQEQLRNRDEMIKRLSIQVNRLNQQGGSSSNYQLSNLLEQGESIRQNTLHLIRMKEGQTGHQTFDKSYLNESQRIRQLEDLLEKEEDEKQNFLNDLLLFKQKYQQLEEENRQLKRQSKFTNSDITKFSPIYDKSSSVQGIGASIQDYEKLLSQMKGFNKY